MFLIIATLEFFLIITGLFCLRKKGPVILYILLAISVIDFINENLIVTHSMKWWGVSGNVFYNIYSILEISCWVIIYYQIFHKRSIKNGVVICGLIILLYSLLEIFVIQSFNTFHTASYACFSMASVFFSFLYLFKVSRKEYHSLASDPAFWICAGAICFNAIFLVNLITMLDPGYWQHNNAREIFHMLQSIAIIIYYLLICIAFIISFYKYPKITTLALL